MYSWLCWYLTRQLNSHHCDAAQQCERTMVGCIDHGRKLGNIERAWEYLTKTSLNWSGWSSCVASFGHPPAFSQKFAGAIGGSDRGPCWTMRSRKKPCKVSSDCSPSMRRFFPPWQEWCHSWNHEDVRHSNEVKPVAQSIPVSQTIGSISISSYMGLCPTLNPHWGSFIAGCSSLITVTCSCCNCNQPGTSI